MKKNKPISLFDKVIYHLSQPKLNIFKTLLFNFKVFPIKEALKLPVYFYGSVNFYWLRGAVEFDCQRIHSGMVKFGLNNEFNNRIKENSFVLLDENSTLTFGGPCSFGTGFLLRCARDSELYLGENTFFGGSQKIICTKKISIGAFTRSAFETQIIDTNSHFILNDGIVRPRDGEVTIGKYNWIGNRCSITKGAKTKPYTIVASNSIVGKDFTLASGANQLLGGIPAKVVGNGFKRIWSNQAELKLIELFKTRIDPVSVSDYLDIDFSSSLDK
jgi:acetyltransferase-like isoleucine patch superfamily enzyme